MRLIAVTLVILFCNANAQPSSQGGTATETHAVTVPFFALDGHGDPTSSSDQIELSVLDDKAPAHSVVGTKSAKDLPLRIGVLIDTSNSERKSSLYGPAVQATWLFLNQILQAMEDRVFIVTFAAIPNSSGFMNKDELQRFDVDLTPGGGTVLFDAVNFACRDRMQVDGTEPARRVLVVLSDGGDNLSHVRDDAAIAEAQKSGTVIFAVSTSESSNAGLDTSRLKQFADKTGGHAFVNLRPKDLPQVFFSIREQIENMYVVTFVPADSGKPGQYHSVELKASDKKVKLRSPMGYYEASLP